MDTVRSRAVAAAQMSARGGVAALTARRIAAGALRVAGIATLLGLLALGSRVARAQSPLEPTQIAIGAPAESNLGTPLTVQALLTDSQGHPIAKAPVFFATQETFLHATGDVILAQAITNGNGQAVAEIKDDFPGTITLQAEFRGDAHYAPSQATTPIVSTGSQQVYAEHVGVDVPGLNVPPVRAPMASVQSSPGGIWGFVASLWPAMNGWPVAAILLLVWSMYLLAVRSVVRVAVLGSGQDDLPEFDSRRQS